MFHLFYYEKLIGKSALEDGDPPMGCAEGVFLAEDAFSDFRANIAPQPDGDPAINRWAGLSLQTEDGVKVECHDAVLFEWDFGDQKELHVDVLGIYNPRYEELFPGRYAAYEASFGNDKSRTSLTAAKSDMFSRLFNKLFGSKPQTTFQFQPRWKEELVVKGPGGSFVLELPMVTYSVYLPTQKAWETTAPEWARELWPLLKSELEDWCVRNKAEFHIDETATVFVEE